MVMKIKYELSAKVLKKGESVLEGDRGGGCFFTLWLIYLFKTYSTGYWENRHKTH